MNFDSKIPIYLQLHDHFQRLILSCELLDQTGKLMRPNYVTEHFSWLLLASGISMKQIQICGTQYFLDHSRYLLASGLPCTDRIWACHGLDV